MMSDLMRLDFEKAMAEMLTRDTDGAVTAMDIMDCRDGDEYKSHVLSGGWWAWQASRECLVIELPKPVEVECAGVGCTYHAEYLDVEQVEKRIESYGVKTK